MPPEQLHGGQRHYGLAQMGSTGSVAWMPAGWGWRLSWAVPPLHLCKYSILWALERERQHMSRDILWKSWENKLLLNLPDLTETRWEVCDTSDCASGRLWPARVSFQAVCDTQWCLGNQDQMNRVGCWHSSLYPEEGDGPWDELEGHAKVKRECWEWRQQSWSGQQTWSPWPHWPELGPVRDAYSGGGL